MTREVPAATADPESQSDAPILPARGGRAGPLCRCRCAWTASQRLAAPFKGYAGSEQFVEVASGSTSQAIGRRLVGAGIVCDTLTFRVALWQSGAARQLKAGEYRFDRPMTPRDVIDTIVKGEVFLRPLTFPEGLTIREMARSYEARGFGRAASFADAARRAALVADLDSAATDLEGYLFPETYAPHAAHIGGRSGGPDGGTIPRGLRPGADAGGRVTGTVRAAGGDAGLAGGEGDRAIRRTPAGGGGLPAASGHRHGAAVRPDGDLRIGARRALPRQPDEGPSEVRLAVQHVPPRRAAARPDCRTGPRLARSGRQAGRRRLPVLRQPERRVTRVLPDPRGTQPQRAALSGAVLPREADAGAPAPKPGRADGRQR